MSAGGVLATDYDETLATSGRVAASTVAALEALRGVGWRLVLVTGRRLDDLRTIFSRTDLFDAIVAENGALLAVRDGRERLLAAPPPAELTEALRRHAVPFVAGRVVVASWDPHGPDVERVLSELRLPLRIILNKDAVMILPPGVDKRSGLEAALREIGASLEETVAVGDAENDEAMIRAAGRGVAVANALAAVKQAADLVTEGERGAGVEELAGRLLYR